MTSSLHERVAAAVELASRATKFNFYFDPAKNYGSWEPISILAERFEDAALLGSAHDHVALIKELYAALLASEEARVKAEVDAGRYRGLRYLAITVGDCSIFDKFKERCYDARAYDGEFDSDSDIAVLAMNSKSVWWRAKRDAAMQVTP